ncbi:hypothetical protein OSTOST_03416 [Ostertagia ostertagi]
MAETKDIPPGSYMLELGKTFTDQRRNDGPSYHTLRYDFKPMSVASSDSDTYIAFGANGDVHVAVPTDGENMTVFKGSKKEAKAKECLLFFDKKTGKVRLEKIASNINVKKTRDLDPSTESVLRSEMARLRTDRIERPPPPEPSSSSFPGADSSSSSDSSSDDSDSDSGSDDEGMAETKDIPPGSYMLELGKTFTDQRRNDGPSYHTLRYDFKPMSVASSDSDTYIAFGANGDVHVAVPTDGENMTVFKGSKKEAKAKECLLFFDKKTGKVRLEKIASNINVKKTRDLDPSTESVLRSEMARLRTDRIERPPPPEPRNTAVPSDSSSDDSDSDSGSDDEDRGKNRHDSNSSMADSDVESHLLESMKTSAAPSTTFSVESIDMPSLDSISQPPPVNTSLQNSFGSRHTAKTDHRDLGLNLSESSDDDE